MRSNDLMAVDIPLTGGMFARVSSEDYELVSTHKWYAAKCAGKYYARRCDSSGRITYLHRFVFGLKCGEKQVVDHIDGDTLNNTRSNIRICTQSANLQNKKMKAHSTPYMGVSKSGCKWVAYTHHNNKKKHLGTFDTAELAAAAYDQEVTHIHGPDAQTNF